MYLKIFKAQFCGKIYLKLNILIMNGIIVWYGVVRFDSVKLYSNVFFS